MALDVPLMVDSPNMFSCKNRPSPVLSRPFVLPLDRKQNKLYKIFNLTDEEATLVEPCACVVHGLDKLNAPVGVEVLMIGAGPTGLLFSQLMKLNGASKVVLAAVSRSSSTC